MGYGLGYEKVQLHGLDMDVKKYRHGQGYEKVQLQGMDRDMEK